MRPKKLIITVAKAVLQQVTAEATEDVLKHKKSVEAEIKKTLKYKRFMDLNRMQLRISKELDQLRSNMNSKNINGFNVKVYYDGEIRLTPSPKKVANDNLIISEIFIQNHLGKSIDEIKQIVRKKFFK